MLAYLAILALISVGALPTGLKAGLTKAMIQDFKEKQLPGILERAVPIKIKDQHESFGQGYFKVTVTLNSIQIPSLLMDVQRSDLVFLEPDKVRLNIEDLSGTGSFNWQYDSPLGGDHGSSEISIAKTHFNVTFALGEHEGRPTINIHDSGLTIGDLNIKIHGTPSSHFVNWLAEVFKDKLKKFISEAFVVAMSTTLNDELTAAVSSVPLWIEISGTPLAVNYTLTAPPKVTANYIEISSAGLFVNKAQPNYSPPVDMPTALPGIDDKGKHLQLWLTEYTINTAFYAAYSANMLFANISSELVPALSPVRLDTSSLNNVLPGITEKYGPNKKVDVVCAASEHPRLYVKGPSGSKTKGEIYGTIGSSCAINVRGQGDAVVLDVKVGYNITAYLEDWKIKGSLDYAQIDELEIKQNNIGKPINAKDLKQSLNFFLGMIVSFESISILGPGIPLPKSETIDLTDSDAVLGTGYIFVQANPKFNVTKQN